MRVLKRVFAVVVIVLAALGVAVAIVPRVLWADNIDTSKVVSIKTLPEYQDPKLLEKAWALPVAQLYKRDIDFQKNGSFCGPTSVVDVDRSLGVKADQGTILEGTDTSTVLGVLPGGLTLDELAAIATKKGPGMTVTVERDIDFATFKSIVEEANDPGTRIIVNFTRASLFATGGGHHSPIAGYLADEDLVLVLDVNKKYQPWLVK